MTPTRNQRRIKRRRDRFIRMVGQDEKFWNDKESVGKDVPERPTLLI